MPGTTSPTYLLTAGGGNIGKRLVPLLLSQPSRPTVILPTSNAAGLTSKLPSTLDKSRLHIVEGSIQDPGFVQQTVKTHNVTAVFLCLTGEDELFTTFNLLDVIKQSGTVKHLVYLSACGDFSPEAIQRGALKGIGAGHVAVKFLVEAKLWHGLLPRDQDGGFSYTILGPSLFFDNDLRFKQGLLEHGVYGQPMGSKGVSLVDPADIALAAAKALEDDGRRWGGRKIMIGSLQTYTNQEAAKFWAGALGKEVTPRLSDKAGLDELEVVFAQHANPAWGRDLRIMFEMFEADAFGMSEAEYKDQVELLGKEPERYEKFVEATAKQWKEE
ncbi:NAD(P)-binding protein [Corynespora cassiicola Philippines]|uniref:NAD(P)-binding protein n=1 Tax=Corynespora cassiicola Philippines TaxID=1448308 RepID=A0A2T2P642_CORCC|nr:NAD(P)-binding protein [Corynespora cassiicola Philippines]